MKKFRKAYHSKNRNYRCLVPYKTIEAAVYGDEEAIREIVKHYGSYILRLAGKEHYTSDGKIFYIVDKTKADIMQISLMESIPKFNSVH